MRVSCILSGSELNDKPVDLIVFPEGVCWNDIEETGLTHPDALIVGAVVENGKSRGILRHRGQNQIDYLKVETDKRTEGTGNTQQNPVYVHGKMCIGVLICMDIDHVEFSSAVINSVKSSSANLKLLCVPADMGAYWMNGNTLPFSGRYTGIHVILCNHVKTHQSRCKSFITDKEGNKIVVQNNREPICAELP